jgi:5-methyltetrahydrofolate--homocysteine methyltransferase
MPTITNKTLQIEHAMHNLHGSNHTAKRDKTIKMTNRKILNKINISEVIPFIDWKMFFHSWKLSAKYHTVLYAECRSKWLASFPENEQERTQEALKLYDDAWEM